MLFRSGWEGYGGVVFPCRADLAGRLPHDRGGVPRGRGGIGISDARRGHGAFNPAEGLGSVVFISRGNGRRHMVGLKRISKAFGRGVREEGVVI